MVKAGELGGVLEVVLTRLAEFMEKAQKIKGKVIAAMFYPVAVLVVATGILIILMVKVVPSFEQVFIGMAEGAQLPAFTRLVLGISRMIKDNILMTLGIVAVFFVLFIIFKRTKFGRHAVDRSEERRVGKTCICRWRR